MSKHSQRPWLYRGKSDSVHERCDTHPYGRQIFRFVEDEAPSDSDLNVILAAPDLLEALEAVVRVADRATDEFDMARAAIAKAKGDPQ